MACCMKKEGLRKSRNIKEGEKVSRTFLKILIVVKKIDLYGPSGYHIPIMQEPTTWIEASRDQGVEISISMK